MVDSLNVACEADTSVARGRPLTSFQPLANLVGATMLGVVGRKRHCALSISEACMPGPDLYAEAKGRPVPTASPSSDEAGDDICDPCGLRTLEL
jgi:hypothetical protein